MLAGSGSYRWSLTLLRTRPLLARTSSSGVLLGRRHSCVSAIRSWIDFDAQTWVPTGIVGGSWQVLAGSG